MNPAVRLDPVINAYNGYSYDSSRPEGKQLQINEARVRMSIKGDNWIGAELKPSFYHQMMETEYYFADAIRQTEVGVAYNDTFAHQDYYCMFMGL